MILGPYKIYEVELQNWTQTMARWEMFYNEFKSIMVQAGYGAFEIPTHLQLYHGLTFVAPDGQITEPHCIADRTGLWVYIIPKYAKLMSVEEFKAKGGKK